MCWPRGTRESGEEEVGRGGADEFPAEMVLRSLGRGICTELDIKLRMSQEDSLPTPVPSNIVPCFL